MPGFPFTAGFPAAGSPGCPCSHTLPICSSSTPRLQLPSQPLPQNLLGTGTSRTLRRTHSHTQHRCSRCARHQARLKFTVVSKNLQAPEIALGKQYHRLHLRVHKGTSRLAPRCSFLLSHESGGQHRAELPEQHMYLFRGELSFEVLVWPSHRAGFA